MKRKIYEKLLEWKRTSAGRTALMIDGARRVGKSYIVEEFAKREYEAYLIIEVISKPLGRPVNGPVTRHKTNRRHA